MLPNFKNSLNMQILTRMLEILRLDLGLKITVLVYVIRLHFYIPAHANIILLDLFKVWRIVLESSDDI